MDTLTPTAEELSPFTNRSATRACVTYPVVFWCATCKMKLPTPSVAYTHFKGRSHRAELALKEKETELTSKKKDVGKTSVPLLQTNTSPSTTKGTDTPPTKDKVQMEQSKKEGHDKPTGKNDLDSITCEDCNLVFNNYTVAIEHFKGKRHVAKVATKFLAKQQTARNPGSMMCGRGYNWGFGRGTLPLPYSNFSDRRMNLFNPKDNFHHSLMHNGPPSRPGYGGGYGTGYPGNGAGGNRSQRDIHNDSQFSSDSKTRPTSNVKDNMYASHLDRDKGDVIKKKNKNNQLSTNTKSNSALLKQDGRIFRAPYNAWCNLGDGKGGYGGHYGYDRPQPKSLWESR